MWGTAWATSARVAKGASTVDDAVNRGWSLTVTSVVMASVPSEPMSSWVRSYPLEHLTNFPPVRSTVPSASTTSSPRTWWRVTP